MGSKARARAREYNNKNKVLGMAYCVRCQNGSCETYFFNPDLWISASA
jgi:hypothetical protein